MKVSIDVPGWAQYVLSDLTNMHRQPHPVAGLKRLKLELPDDVYFEYAFLDAHGRMRADPQNPLRAKNPWYTNVSALMGPHYQAHQLANPVKPQGRSQRERLASKVLGQTYRLILYSPVGHEDASLPLVVVQDGQAYYHIAGLPGVLESLLQASLIRPAHLLFIEPHDRDLEYRFYEGYQTFVLSELIPFAKERLAIHEILLLGASLGGLLSASLALKNPGTFHSVICQSAAFLGTPSNPDVYYSADSWVLQQLEHYHDPMLRWYLEVGTLEWLTDINRSVQSALQASGAELKYTERNAGHNWVNWRNGIADALSFALAL